MGCGTGGADQGFCDNWLTGGWDAGNLGIASREERKQGVKLTGYNVILLSNTLKPYRAEFLRLSILPKYRSTIRALRAYHQKFPRM